MEYVWSGWVVYDYNASQVATETVEVLHIVPAVEHAAIPEQSSSEHAPSEIYNQLYVKNLYLW